jgi:hypothetical protein
MKGEVYVIEKARQLLPLFFSASGLRVKAPDAK